MRTWFGAACIAARTLVIIFRIPYAQYIMRWNETVWRHRYGESERRLALAITTTTGIAFVVGGILILARLGNMP